MQVKSGADRVEAPVYSHLDYDIVRDRTIVVERPDILIIEGLNVLQPARAEHDPGLSLAVSDFFDFSVFVDAEESLIKTWFLERFMTLRETAFQDERSFFRMFTAMSEHDAHHWGSQVWDTINGPNLRQNIAPTRDRATAILVKGANHTIDSIRIRKV
jgi:type I pantothenate kinase